MAKKLTRSKLVKKLDAIFSQYIRLKNSVDGYATCFTCGKKDHWKKLQCGHFQSRKNYSTRFGTLDDDDKITELNCQVQCAGCNVFRYGEQYLFAKYLDDTYYNGLSEELYIKSKKIVKLDNFDLEMLISKYQNLTDKLTK